MEFIKKNKVFSGVAVGSALLGAFVALDSLKQLKKLLRKPKAVEEEQLNAPEEEEEEESRGRRASTNEEFTEEIKRFKPIFKICLTGGKQRNSAS